MFQTFVASIHLYTNAFCINLLFIELESAFPFATSATERRGSKTSSSVLQTSREFSINEGTHELQLFMPPIDPLSFMDPLNAAELVSENSLLRLSFKAVPGKENITAGRREEGGEGGGRNKHQNDQVDKVVTQAPLCRLHISVSHAGVESGEA